MKKKVSPKNQTKELNRAMFEFIQRNPFIKKQFDEENKSFREFYEQQRAKEQANLKEFPEMRELYKRLGWKPKPEADEVLKDGLVEPGATDLTLTFIDSWRKILSSKQLKKHPLSISYEDKQKIYRDQIIKDAKEILAEIVPPHPSEFAFIKVNLTRSKEVILAEFDEIVTEILTGNKKEKSTEWILDENGKLIDKVYKEKNERLKWLPILDELLEVWDLYEQAGKKPARMTFRDIARITGRAESTIKDQWRTAYEKIYSEPYKSELKYSTEVKKADATQLCAKCLHGGKCYRGGDWLPCNDYLKIAGKEKNIKLTEYRDDILYND